MAGSSVSKAERTGRNRNSENSLIEASYELMNEQLCKIININFFLGDFSPKVAPIELEKFTQTVRNLKISDQTYKL